MAAINCILQCKCGAVYEVPKHRLCRGYGKMCPTCSKATRSQRSTQFMRKSDRRPSYRAMKEWAG